MIAAGGHARFAWVVQLVGRSMRDAGSIPASGTNSGHVGRGKKRP